MCVNGKEIPLNTPCTIAQYLNQEGFRTERVAVERNGEIISHDHLNEITLCDNDILEIITYMGGG